MEDPEFRQRVKGRRESESRAVRQFGHSIIDREERAGQGLSQPVFVVVDLQNPVTARRGQKVGRGEEAQPAAEIVGAVPFPGPDHRTCNLQAAGHPTPFADIRLYNREYVSLNRAFELVGRTDVLAAGKGMRKPAGDVGPLFRWPVHRDGLFNPGKGSFVESAGEV